MVQEAQRVRAIRYTFQAVIAVVFANVIATTLQSVGLNGNIRESSGSRLADATATFWYLALVSAIMAAFLGLLSAFVAQYCQ